MGLSGSDAAGGERRGGRRVPKRRESRSLGGLRGGAAHGRRVKGRRGLRGRRERLREETGRDGVGGLMEQRYESKGISALSLSAAHSDWRSRSETHTSRSKGLGEVDTALN